MSVVLILLSASLIVALGFLIAFIWSVKNGQYEDDYTPSVRMLFDDKSPATSDNPDEHKADAPSLEKPSGSDRVNTKTNI